MEKNTQGSGKKTAEQFMPALKRFHQNLSIYVITNIVLVLIWLISGDSYFWPIWVIIGWGIAILFMAYEAGILPSFLQNMIRSLCNSIPFMRESWVKEKAQQMARSANGNPQAFSEEGPASVASRVAKGTVKKRVAPSKKLQKAKAVSPVKTTTVKKKPAKKTTAAKKK